MAPGEAGRDWLWQIIQRKKPRQAAIARANRMAHALMKNKTEYLEATAA